MFQTAPGVLVSSSSSSDHSSQSGRLSTPSSFSLVMVFCRAAVPSMSDRRSV